MARVSRYSIDHSSGEIVRPILAVANPAFKRCMKNFCEGLGTAERRARDRNKGPRSRWCGIVSIAGKEPCSRSIVSHFSESRCDVAAGSDAGNARCLCGVRAQEARSDHQEGRSQWDGSVS